MMRKWMSWLICLLFSSSIHTANALNEIVSAKPTTSTTNSIFTLTQLSGVNGLELRGGISSKTFYLPVPKQWQLKNILLHLKVMRTPLNIANNVLTLYVNDIPVSVATQKAAEDGYVPWDVVLASDAQKGDVVSLKFMSMTNDSGYNCYNLDNPNYWAFISGDSTVDYHYTLLNFVPDLKQFPSPFITKPPVEKDVVTLVYPDEPSTEDVSAAFYIANTLAHYASWKGVDISAMPLSAFAASDKKATNVIMIGQSDVLRLENLTIKLPLGVENGRLMDENGKPLMSDKGVIILAASPWDVSKALLLITGNSPQAVTKAVLGLRDENFTNSVLYNEYSFVSQLRNINTTKISWHDVSLEALGYKDALIEGIGQRVLNYDLDLPETKIPAKMSLSLQYIVSPFLVQGPGSYLTLQVNDIPVDGTHLFRDGTKMQTWQAVVSGHMLHPGRNRISIIFNMQLQRDKCTPGDYTLAWAKLSSSSNLDVAFSDVSPDLNLSMFMHADNALLLAVPEDQSFLSNQKFIQAVIDFGKIAPYGNQFTVISSKKLSSDNAVGKNIIYLGRVIDNPVMQSLLPSLPFVLTNNKFVIKPALESYLNISQETPSALMEVIPSPFSQNKMMLLIDGHDGDALLKAFSLLSSQAVNKYVNGDAVLIYPNSTFTSLQSQRIAITGKNKEIIASSSRIARIVIIGIALLAFLMLLGYFVFKKIKYYFYRNK